MKEFTIKVINIWTDNAFCIKKRFPSAYYADRYASRLFLKASRHSPYIVTLVID